MTTESRKLIKSRTPWFPTKNTDSDKFKGKKPTTKVLFQCRIIKSLQFIVIFNGKSILHIIRLRWYLLVSQKYVFIFLEFFSIKITIKLTLKIFINMHVLSYLLQWIRKKQCQYNGMFIKTVYNIHVRLLSIIYTSCPLNNSPYNYSNVKVTLQIHIY